MWYSFSICQKDIKIAILDKLSGPDYMIMKEKIIKEVAEKHTKEYPVYIHKYSPVSLAFR